MHLPRKSILARRTTVSGASAVIMLVGGASFCAPALALPKGRTYEMVSPVYKGGYGVNGIAAVAPNGESIAFSSLGAFAGDPSNNPTAGEYFARRGAGVGWTTAPLALPATISAFSALVDFSPTLESSFYNVRLGPNFGDAGSDSNRSEYLIHSTDSPDSAPNFPNLAPNFQPAGFTLEEPNPPSDPRLRTDYEGASTNFSHTVFTDYAENAEQLLPEAIKTSSHLYELSTSQACGQLTSAVCGEGAAEGEGSLRLVALNNQGKVFAPSCGVQFGDAESSGRFNAVSADGSEMFFATCPGDASLPSQLFVRLGGEKTREVSRPLLPACNEVPCPGAGSDGSVFLGASEDGSKVFFETAQSLVPGSTDVSNNIYMASIGCPGGEESCEPAEREVTGLVRVSHDPNTGESAEAQGVVAIAPDGSHIYYVARGDLLSPVEREVLADKGLASPQVGADNLYVFDSDTGKTGFVAELCSGSQLSGSFEDVNCPEVRDINDNDTRLWSHGGHEAQVNVCARESVTECTGDLETGRFLVFSTYAQLSGGDTDNARDVYRYDALTGALERVSVGEGGHDANGNGYDTAKLPGETTNKENADATIPVSVALGVEGLARQRNMESRVVSEDGSRIAFTTAEPLSSLATNGLSNAYEWHEGGVSLVSGGSATRAVEEVVISSSGRDLFFTTTQGLVPQDTDGQEDTYDARIGGGFPAPPAESRPCEGDACQGPLTNPAPLLIPGSVSQAPGGNFVAPVSTTSVKQKKIKAKIAKCKKGFVKKKDKCVKRSAGKGSGRRERSK